MAVTVRKQIYLVDNTCVYSRPEFEQFILGYIKENKLFSLRNLTRSGLEIDVRHHPLRLAREIGFDVTTYYI